MRARGGAHGSRRAEKLPTISATRAFMGATYTILKAEVSMEPSGLRCSPICAPNDVLHSITHAQ